MAGTDDRREPRSSAARDRTGGKAASRSRASDPTSRAATTSLTAPLRRPASSRQDRRPSRPRVVDPVLPVEVTGRELDRAVRAELRTLTGENADLVARHLVMAARLVDEDPESAVAHAMAAQRRAGRIAAVREAVGITAYLAGRYGDALAELRAARRMSGSHEHLPVMADCERGLRRPERALELARSPEVNSLDQAGRIEMRIVAAGARRDLGQTEAAVLTLAVPELRTKGKAPWLARLRYAYADALLALERVAEAREWFALAADADEYEDTDAGARLADLEGVSFVDLDDATDWDASDDLSSAVSQERLSTDPS